MEYGEELLGNEHYHRVFIESFIFKADFKMDFNKCEKHKNISVNKPRIKTVVDTPNAPSKQG